MIGTRQRIQAAEMILGLAALLAVVGSQGATPTETAGDKAPEHRPPLASLPSRPAPHVEKIRALGDNAWLNLGKPTPDPLWGPAPGRSYTNKMAFAPDRRGAFLYGEGVHGACGTGPRADYYNDDLFFYDINAHAWVCVYPGSNVKTLKMKLDANGFEVSEDGQAYPIAAAVHGYECTSYDPHLGKFMTLFTGSPYCRKVNERRREWLGEKKPLGREMGMHPFFYDVKTGQWERRKVNGSGPVPHFCRVLWYIPSKKQTLFYDRKKDFWFYDHAANQWTHTVPSGAPPDSDHFEGVVCHDNKRDRLYIFNAGQTSVPWIYDLKSNAFIDPQAKDQPYTARDLKAGRRSFSSTTSMAHYDSVNDVVVVKLVVAQGEGDRRNVPNKLVGMAIYDPEQNEWRKDILPAPQDLPQRRAWNGFYDQELGVHFYHLAGDSATNGEIWVYRYKKAPSR